eukprot:TRINITY_DN3211_c0_g1_i3.p2 TRINITY_DN3211_c0_g1~~TRINITY_DN3211_c0_g1_i3.p2  ORF type:complete len:237 (-),score=23.44 TRINITY_DN3211_c0_g1_i3:214-924(-)
MKGSTVWFLLILLLVRNVEGQGVSVCESVTDVLRRRDDLSFFNSLIQNIEGSLLNNLERPARKVAIFVPNDEAWNKISSPHLSQIIDNTTALNQLINQHVLEQVPNINSLTTISGNFSTLLEDSGLSIEGLSPEVDGSVRVLQSKSKERSSVVEVVRLCLNRGIIFVVNKVLLPVQFEEGETTKTTEDISLQSDPKFLNPLFAIVPDPKFFNSRITNGEDIEENDPKFINPKFRNL